MTELTLDDVERDALASHLDGVPVVIIQRQLGHADVGITSKYLRGMDNAEIIHTVHERPAPMIPATTGPLAPR